MKIKICFVSGSRADYGIASRLLKKLKESRKFNLSLIASCMHLSPKYGNTFKEIENDGFKITKKVFLPLNSNTKKNFSISAGTALIKFSKIIDTINPDILLLVGDRYETFAAAFTSLVYNIPIAHIHGGELTLSAIDDSIRHSITKMSSIHFVSHQDYGRRVKQLGENPKNVHTVGSLGVENINKIKFYNKKDVERKINLSFNKNNFLVTLHPETINRKYLEKVLPKIIKQLEKIKDTNIVFTSPNSDPGNLLIKNIIKKTCKLNKDRFIFVKSMGQKLYFSYLKYCNLVIGNSSSGIIEVPSFRIPTINIGLRQQGRIRCKSILDINYDHKLFNKFLKKALSKNYTNKLKKLKSPYFQKNTSNQIIRILSKKNFNEKELIKKKFHDIKKI